MRIIVDAFGGDNAPLEIIKGCAAAVEKLGVEITLTGSEEKIKKVAAENGIDLRNITIYHAPDVITMEDEPGEIVKSFKNSSMAQGLKLLGQGEGDAFVSAGNTGALVVGSTFLVKRIKGISRAALAPIVPADTDSYMLIDAGANTECRPEMLRQFAIMGAVYMEKVMGRKDASVGLVNIGTEEIKGRELETSAYSLLQNSPVNFIGNVEARSLPFGVCDVAVTDGFTGNIVLKLTEGVASALGKNIKDIFKKNLKTKIAAALVMKGLIDFKKKLDYTEYGGAPLLGISRPVFKAHGSSNHVAIMNAIRLAADFAKTGVISEIEKRLEELQKAETETERQ